MDGDIIIAIILGFTIVGGCHSTNWRDVELKKLEVEQTWIESLQPPKIEEGD